MDQPVHTVTVTTAHESSMAGSSKGEIDYIYFMPFIFPAVAALIVIKLIVGVLWPETVPNVPCPDCASATLAGKS